LNIDERRAELAEADRSQHERNQERRERFAKMAQADSSSMRFFKLTLDDLEEGKGLREVDPSQDADDYMRRAEDKTAELDDTPEWPSKLDPTKREALNVLSDLVDITRNARMAGLLKENEIR